MAKAKDEKPASNEPPKKQTDESAALESAGKALTSLPGETDQPKFGTARAAAPGPVPRVAHQLERAGNGAKRFKCFADPDGASRTPTKYVLAGDETSAAKFYADKFKVPDAKLVKCLELAD